MIINPYAFGFAQPTVQASAVILRGVNTTTLKFSWTNGNGTSRIVLMRSGSAVNSDPVDGTGYTANAAFGSGTEIGTGNYVVHIGSGPVTVTGITTATTYHIAVYEFSGSGSGANYLVTSPATGLGLTASEIGSLHSDNFDSGSLANYTQSGSMFSIVSSNLRLTASGGVYTNYLRITNANVKSAFTDHTLEKWKMTARFTTPTLSGTTFGFAMGVRSNQAAGLYDNLVWLPFYTSHLSEVHFVTAANHSGTPNDDTQATGYTMLSATIYKFIVERNKNVITTTLATDADVVLFTLSKTYNITSANSIIQATYGNFCLWAIGGTFDIHSVDVTSTALKNSDLVAIGDSNTNGTFAGTTANRYIEQAAAVDGQSFEIIAGNGAQVTDTPVESILALEPRMILINLGRNDLFFGASEAATEARLSTLISRLNAAGYGSTKVIICTPIASTVALATLTAYIQSQHSTYTIVDLYGTTQVGGALNDSYDIGDDVHLNTTGNAACATPTANGIATAINAGLPATVWNPDQTYSILTYWDNGSSHMAADGSQWTDRISAKNLTAAGTARPTLTPNALNSLSSYLFDGTTDVLAGSRITEIQGIGGLTMWAVGRRFCFSHDDNGGNRTGLIHLFSDDLIYAMANVGGSRFGTVSTTNVFSYAIYTFDGSQATNATRMRLFKNSIQQSLSFTGTIGAVTEASATSVPTIGNTGTTFCSGEMLEYGIIPRALSTQEIAALNTYLATKYAL